MKNFVSFVILFFLPGALVYGSFGEKPPLIWGKVTAAEFNVHAFNNDTAVPAIVLCDYGTIDISNRTFYTRHTRIKINNEAGLKYAAVEIPYQTRDKHDDFIELKAETFILENGKILRYKLPAKQIEDVKINNRWSKKKFTFPKVKPGAIVEFYYTIASLDFENLEDWNFQREIPTLWSEIRFQVPEPFYFLVTFQYNHPLTITDEQEYGAKLQWLYSTKLRKAEQDLFADQNVLFVTADKHYKVWLMNNFKKKIVMKDLSGLPVGKNAANLYDRSPKLSFHLFESVGQLPRSYMPLLVTTLDDYEWRNQWELLHDRSNFAGFVNYRLKTWDEFNDALLKSDHFGLALSRSYGRKDQLDSITGNSTNAIKKMENIFDFVRHNFSWDGNYSMYTQYKFSDFISGRKGSSADINLMLVNLLRKSGLQADPLLIRTSDLGAPEKMYPVRDQFNQVIALVVIDGKQYLLDATDKTSPVTMLSKKDIGTNGWIVRKDNPGWINVFSKEPGPVEKDSEVPVFEL